MNARILLISAIHLVMLHAASTASADDFTADFEGGYLRGWTKIGAAFDA